MCYIDAIKKHCEEERKRPEEEAFSLYTERRVDFEKEALPVPGATPIWTADKREGVVNPSEIHMAEDFTYYHHTRDAVVQYAVEHRGDADFLLQEMQDLHLEEYPAPSSSGKAYKVGKNGHHRSVVFKCIGLPVVKAKIVSCCSKTWTYKIGISKDSKKLINWLEKKGLIENTVISEYTTLKFDDPTGFIGWIMPKEPEIYLSIDEFANYSLINDVSEKLKLMESAFGARRPRSLNIARYPRLWRVSIDLLWMVDHKKYNLPFSNK